MVPQRDFKGTWVVTPSSGPSELESCTVEHILSVKPNLDIPRSFAGLAEGIFVFQVSDMCTLYGTVCIRYHIPCASGTVLVVKLHVNIVVHFRCPRSSTMCLQRCLAGVLPRSCEDDPYHLVYYTWPNSDYLAMWRMCTLLFLYINHTSHTSCNTQRTLS